MSATTVRPPAVAGRFYPGSPAELQREVDDLLAVAGAAAQPADVPPKLLLVPHAGYVYSGAMAARGFALLAPWRGRIRRVLLLCPTHRVAVRGLAAPAAAALATPLGEVPVDRDALAAIADLPQVVASDVVHADEHAIEVQLPFLQRCLGAFTLLPLAVGRATPQQVAEVLERLWGGDETLVVVSSDLSHYLPYDEARARDRATIDRVLHLDTALTHDDACGATPLAGALIAARAHGLAPRLLGLCNSGDTGGNSVAGRQHVVGYAAVAFEPAAAEGHEDADARRATNAAGDPALGPLLVARARAAIAAGLGLAPAPAPAAAADHPALAQPGACFVTLHRDGRLRGCIGSLEARRPLGEDLRHNARAAAFSDPRFAPLGVDEFDQVDIEVSLLSPTEPLAVRSEAEALRALRPGRDGVVLTWRGRRSTFLPQVWAELPQPSAFLRALRRKAGLAEDFWSDDLALSRYTVREFHEPRGGRSA